MQTENETRVASPQTKPSVRYDVPPWIKGEPKIFAATVAVLRAFAAVEKGKNNVQQGYKFRGIDDVFNSLHPALADAGVLTVPKTLQRVQLADRPTGQGKPMLHVLLEVEFWLTCEDGSAMVVGPLWGEALDNSDKATNKCMSFAMKYALLNTFTIPTEDIAEGDRVTHSIVDEVQAQRQQQRESFAGANVQSEQSAQQQQSPDAGPRISEVMAAKVYAGFQEFGVSKEALDRKLGRPVVQCGENMIETLRLWKDRIKKDRKEIVAIFGAQQARADRFNNRPQQAKS